MPTVICIIGAGISVTSDQLEGISWYQVVLDWVMGEMQVMKGVERGKFFGEGGYGGGLGGTVIFFQRPVHAQKAFFPIFVVKLTSFSQSLKLQSLFLKTLGRKQEYLRKMGYRLRGLWQGRGR